MYKYTWMNECLFSQRIAYICGYDFVPTMYFSASHRYQCRNTGLYPSIYYINHQAPSMLWIWMYPKQTKQKGNHMYLPNVVASTHNSEQNPLKHSSSVRWGQLVFCFVFFFFSFIFVAPWLYWVHISVKRSFATEIAVAHDGDKEKLSAIVATHVETLIGNYLQSKQNGDVSTQRHKTHKCFWCAGVLVVFVNNTRSTITFCRRDCACLYSWLKSNQKSVKIHNIIFWIYSMAHRNWPLGRDIL